MTASPIKGAVPGCRFHCWRISPWSPLLGLRRLGRQRQARRLTSLRYVWCQWRPWAVAPHLSSRNQRNPSQARSRPQSRNRSRRNPPPKMPRPNATRRYSTAAVDPIARPRQRLRGRELDRHNRKPSGVVHQLAADSAPRQRVPAPPVSTRLTSPIRTTPISFCRKSTRTGTDR